MININNWDEIKQRYEQYWNRQNKTPLLSVTAPKKGKSYDYPEPIDSNQFWFDADWIVGACRAGNETTYFAGDAYPCVSPSLGTGLMSALLGLPLNYNESSSWVEHKHGGLSQFTDFTLDKSNFYFKKMEEILTKFAEDAKNGDYIVGMVDLNTLFDGVASLVGAEDLCYELLDNPDEVKRVMREHIALYKQVFTHYSDIVTKYQGGNTNWLGIYSDIPWYFISDDFIVMISQDFFAEFTAEPLREIASFHERNLFHLDGENAVVHLDGILAIDEITGVQVQATPFVHTAELWIPHLKKIQSKGKLCMIEARNLDDISCLIRSLEPEGLYIRMGAQSEEEADAAVQLINTYYPQRHLEQ